MAADYLAWEFWDLQANTTGWHHLGQDGARVLVSFYVKIEVSFSLLGYKSVKASFTLNVKYYCVPWSHLSDLRNNVCTPPSGQKQHCSTISLQGFLFLCQEVTFPGVFCWSQAIGHRMEEAHKELNWRQYISFKEHSNSWISVYARPVKPAACGSDTASTGQTYPRSAKAKTSVIHYDTARDARKFDTPGLCSYSKGRYRENIWFCRNW